MKMAIYAKSAVAPLQISLCILAALHMQPAVVVAQSHTLCNVPSELWCDTPEIQKLCNTTVQCAKYNQTVKSHRLNLTIVYEALCPYCQNFTRDVLYPKVWKHLHDVIDIKMIPYGNAKETKVNGTTVITCQNGVPAGVPECYANRLHNCIIHHYPDAKVYVPFIACMEDLFAASCTSKCTMDQVKNVTASCYKQEQFTSDVIKTLETCRDGPEGTQLLHDAGVETRALWPQPHKYTPWFAFQNVSTNKLQEYRSVLDKFICSSWRGPPGPPDYCNQ